jgi:hypothetical protein
MRVIVIIMAVIIAAGCAKTVYVPVSTCVEPPPCGTLLTPLLPKDATPEQQLTAIRADFIELYRCKALLDGYRKP